MSSKKNKVALGIGALVATVAALTGCAASADESSEVVLDYGLWDATFVPAYEECAAEFEKDNPGITVTVSQAGWSDYWTNLTTGFGSGEAPDVFTNHVSRYPEFQANGVLLDIQPMLDESDIDLDLYHAGLADLWVKDGARYGLPTNWVTTAVAYNADAVVEAGLTESELQELDWNPADGGTYQQAIQRLSLDSSGRDGTDPAFDKDNVVRYGAGAPDANPYGEETWSSFAASNGFRYLEGGPFGTPYLYDSEALQETLNWYASMIEAGYMLSPTQKGELGDQTLMEAGTIALTTQGSWNAGAQAEAAVPIHYAPNPIGPEGGKTMVNGLTDSIFAGTEHPEEAWRWVEFLASESCQAIVADHAIAFPALDSELPAAVEAYQAKGVDLAPFLAHAEDPSSTFNYPITTQASSIIDILSPVLLGIYLGERPSSELVDANDQVNSLFE